MRTRPTFALLFCSALAGCARSDHVIGTEVRPDAGESAGPGAVDASAAGAGGSNGQARTGGASNGGARDAGAPSGGAPMRDAGPSTPLDPAQIPPPDPNAVTVPNLDSAVINVEAVDGAKDYRAFIVRDGVEVLVDAEGRESVKGATIFCAGQKQRAAPKLPVAEVMRQIEVTDLKEPSEFVVEAIDQLCPFPGLLGKTDASIKVSSPDAIQYHPELVVPIPIVSEATIRARYGSMIVNGQGPASQPGQPADPINPKVLKRWTVKVGPLDAAAAAKRRTSTFFEDFSKDEPFQWVTPPPDVFQNGDGTFHEPENYGYSYAVYQNSRFVAYATNTELIKGNYLFYDRGQLQTNLPDSSQDVMGTVMAMPKTLAHFTDEGYLHVTFESSTNSTSRRYWWLSLCGADTPGQTMTSEGLLTNVISLSAGFWNPDARNPSSAGWNCLIVFPHDGLAIPIPDGASTFPQSSAIVTLHKSNAPALQTAVNVSPQQVSDAYPPSWYRRMKAGKVTETSLFDDLLQQAPRAHFDIYVSRQRLVMYVNGEQRLCNDFGPERLTMAEAAVGFNDALYHSSAEHTELTVSFADRSGQLYYLENTLYADAHTWDNVGFEEGVSLPSSYTDADCYTYAP